jgi:hypothetical protein
MKSRSPIGPYTAVSTNCPVALDAVGDLLNAWMQAGLKALVSRGFVQLVGLGTENLALPVGAFAYGIPRKLLTAAVAP